MFRKYLAGSIVLPVLLAAWLTFSASPVVGLPLDQVATFDLPEETSNVAEGYASAPAETD